MTVAQETLAAPAGCEVVDVGSDAAVRGRTKEALGLVEVSGSSAEPYVLHGQFLLIGAPISPESACRVLDGRPVLATDSDGHQYFKRLRAVSSQAVILESLHAGGDYPPVLLALQGNGDPFLQRILPVVGVLFERN